MTVDLNPNDRFYLNQDALLFYYLKSSAQSSLSRFFYRICERYKDA